MVLKTKRYVIFQLRVNSEAIKPVSYFKNHMAEVIRQLNDNQGTMIITQNGEAKAAIIDIREFEQMQETIAMLKLIAQGKKSLAAKRFRPAEDVLQDLESSIDQDPS
jgi:prevent-host-death family protein